MYFCFRGCKSVLRKRLKSYYRMKFLSEAQISKEALKVDFLMVIDFEATCQQKNGRDYLHEIIEFPIVLIDVAQKKMVRSLSNFKSKCVIDISKFLVRLVYVP